MTDYKRWLTTAGAVLLMLMVPAIAFGQRSSPDEDGCYATARDCVVGRTEWGTGMNSDRYYLRVTNNCSGRVYVRACMLMATGQPRCGVFSLQPGETHNFNWTNAHDSGRVEWRWTGSLQPSKDWVCAGKVAGFNDDPDF